METYQLAVQTASGISEMKFLYLNQQLSLNAWKRDVYHEYLKINVFLVADCTIIIENQAFHVQNQGILCYNRFTRHHGILPHAQHVEYFELLIPEDFFGFVPGCEGWPEQILNGGSHFHMESLRFEELTRMLFELRSQFIRNAPNILLLGKTIELLQFLISHKDQGYKLPASHALTPQILEIMAHIRQNFSKIASIEALAKDLHISVSRICRIFRQQLQISPHRFLVTCRLEAAQQLLHRGCSVTQAAMETGFPNVSSFIQSFKQHYGTTLGAYQRKR